MALLLRHLAKKMKASTLVEVLVASVLIIVIFSMASLALNSLFRSSTKANTTIIDNELNKLYYLYEHQKIGNDYTADFSHWELSIIKQKEKNFDTFILRAKNTQTDKIRLKIVNRELSE